MSDHSYSSLSFGAYCPDGSTWYACQNSESFPFVGCSISNPCGRSSPIPDSDVRPMSFNATWHAMFADQKCDYGGAFFTCEATKPPFMGCCAQENFGCSGNCTGYLKPATLAGTDFTGAGPSFSSSGSVPSATSAGPSSPPSSTADSGDSNGGGGGLSTGAIAGIAVGAGVLGILAIAAFIWFIIRRKKAAKDANAQMTQPPAYSAAQSPNPNAGPWSPSNYDPKGVYSPVANQHEDPRYSHISGSTYFGPGSPNPDQVYAKHAGSPQMSQPGTPFQGGWGPHSPQASPHMGGGGFQRNEDTIAELAVAEPPVPVEIGDSTHPEARK